MALAPSAMAPIPNRNNNQHVYIGWNNGGGEMIILRLITLPVIAVAVLIFYLAVWLKWCFNFAAYGGELIAYPDKHDRATISKIYEALKEGQNENLHRL